MPLAIFPDDYLLGHPSTLRCSFNREFLHQKSFPLHPIILSPSWVDGLNLRVEEEGENRNTFTLGL